MKVMKAQNNIYSEETKTALPDYRRSIKKIICRWSRYFIAIIFMIFLLMSFSPVNASPGPGKSKKSATCRARRTSHTYPVILTGKNKSKGSKKNHKKSRTRNYSFPV